MQRSWRHLAWLVLGVTLVVAAALLFVRTNTRERLIRSVNAAEERRIEGRLSRSAPAVFAAIAEGQRHDAHSAAIAKLLHDEPATAVARFETLVARSPNDAALWSDLAAARLEDAKTADDARSIAKALAAADRALELNPASPEALFNRALALDALGLRFAAVDAWRRYLDVDPSSAWSIEARERLVKSEAPTREEAWKRAEVELDKAIDRGDTSEVQRIVAQFPQHARFAVETVHLPAWGAAVLAHKDELAERSLIRARSIAAALKHHNGDSLLGDAVGHLTNNVAPAFRTYGQARAHAVDRKIHEALEGFTEAERALAAAGNPMALSAAFYRANALVDVGRFDESKTIATRLARELPPSYRSLRAHLYWLEARHTNDAGHHYESLLVTRDAIALFEKLGERDHASRMRIAEAAMLARLGRDWEAWQSRRTALAGAAAAGKWQWIEMSIDAIAREEIDGRDRDVAGSLLRIQVAVPSALPLMRFNGLLWSAYLDARDSAPDLTAARNAAERIPDPKQRADAMDDLRLAEGLALRESEPARAEALLSGVIDYRTRNGLATYVPAIHLQRARLRRRMSREQEAEEDLRRAIELIESRRGRIRDENIRDTFLGRSEDAYADLGELLLARGDWMGAFAIAERARARILLDKADRDVMPLPELVASMPAGVIGAHYTSFASRTLLVVLERDRVTHHVLGVDAAEIRALRDRPDSEVAARRLYDLLIAPLEDRLATDRLLVIAPDETTYGIAFAALRDRNGRFLIEKAPIAFAPMGAALATAPSTIVPLQASVTIVADPAFSSDVFPRLDRLPAARRDADTVKRAFGEATVLAGENATLSALAPAARECDVLHIGAHAFSSARDASLSLIALAPDESDEGLLHLESIESLSLPRRPLVVLAGCQTLSFGGGTGSIRSLAHAFLAVGSRAVLASLWNIGDDEASVLTTAFYRNLARGMTLPEALREAQLRELSRAPREWAGVQLLMGVAPTGKTGQRVPLTE